VHEDATADYHTPYPLQPNQWGFTGRWTIGEEKSTLDAPNGSITYRFNARDVHLVLGPGAPDSNGKLKPVRFKVTLDGQPPGAGHGMDSDAAGNGVVTSQRLYQLIRQNGQSAHTFAIQFLDPGVQAFAFTFG
jgi:hypothetical protein